LTEQDEDGVGPEQFDNKESSGRLLCAIDFGDNGRLDAWGGRFALQWSITCRIVI